MIRGPSVGSDILLRPWCQICGIPGIIPNLRGLFQISCTHLPYLDHGLALTPAFGQPGLHDSYQHVGYQQAMPVPAPKDIYARTDHTGDFLHRGRSKAERFASYVPRLSAR